ncbi:uncharacterized protein LOC135400609 [Ornithodoros turicata]|uniref:uncharacterized protein LOC135400609 n=1 Tax=Ornithodoros turicata TaxID=34597 RepID=UPI003138FF9B
MPVSSIAVKLPPYWDRIPSTWFIQAEAKFHLAGISSQRTKFYHVIAALSPSAAEEVFDIIASPPADDPYDSLKNALLKRTSPSDRARLQQLLSSEELRDRRPSQLLRRMWQLHGEGTDATTQNFLRELFLQRLPRNVQTVLATASKLSIDELASLVDAVMEVAAPSIPSVAALQASAADSRPSQDNSPAQPSLAAFSQQVNHLTSLVVALTARSRSPPPRRQRSRSPRHPRRGSPNGLCTVVSAITPTTASNHVRGRETRQPTTDGWEWTWPYRLPPILHHGPLVRLAFFG